MPRANSISPFPADIDRHAFGHYLSGFVDGEGCFYLGTHKHKKSKSDYRQPCFWLSIKLRIDDCPILDLIRSYWQCGEIFLSDLTAKPGRPNDKPQARYCIQSAYDLFEVVLPHFDHFPLRAKKAKDFVIFKEAILLAYKVAGRPYRMGASRRVSSWNDDELSYFAQLTATLRGQREFSAATLPVPAPPPPEQELLLFD